jgi:hypothetical protein
MTMVLELPEVLEEKLRHLTNKEAFILQAITNAFNDEEESVRRNRVAEQARNISALFAEWEAEEGDLTEEEIQQRQVEWEDFKQNMNLSRQLSGEVPVY